MVNYNNISREPLPDQTQVPMDNLIPEPTVESVPTNETKLETKPEPVSDDESKYATVVCPSHLNVRQSADILSPVVHVLHNGDTVILEDVQEDWTHVQISQEIEGYSLSKYIVPTPIE